MEGTKKIKSKSFHQYSWNSEVETIWISLIGWHHKTSTIYIPKQNRSGVVEPVGMVQSFPKHFMKDLLLTKGLWKWTRKWPFAGLKLEDLENKVPVCVCVRKWELKMTKVGCFWKKIKPALCFLLEAFYLFTFWKKATRIQNI